MLIQAALLAAAVALGYNAFGNQGQHALGTSGSDQKPNILFIFTDDQDKVMNSLDYM